MRRTQDRDIERRVYRPTPGAVAESRRWSRLLDGAHAWGSFDAVVGRYGVRRYRLIIYPPGTSTADRRLARLWRGWPISGAALVLFAVVMSGGVVASPDTVLALGVGAYVSVGALLFMRAGPARVRVRSMSVVLMPEADKTLATGAIALVEHEATCWEAYDRLEVIACA
jgi:hypothetical protein